MSKYIVFQCRHCGKYNSSELRDTSLLKKAKVLAKKRLLCKYCDKHSQYDKTNIKDLFTKGVDAMNLAKRLNLEANTDLSLEFKMAITKKGENYVKDETTKTYE